jgi:hypothetical protein
VPPFGDLDLEIHSFGSYFEIVLESGDDIDFLFVIFFLELLGDTFDGSLDIGLFGVDKDSIIICILNNKRHTAT